MSRAIRFHQTGGPEVLKLETVEVGEPGPGQARVRHTFVAVNFIDVYFRTGHYPVTAAERPWVGRSGGGRGRRSGGDRHPRR